MSALPSPCTGAARLLGWIECYEGRKPPAEAFPDPMERRIAELILAFEAVAMAAAKVGEHERERNYELGDKCKDPANCAACITEGPLAALSTLEEARLT